MKILILLFFGAILTLVFAWADSKDGRRHRGTPLRQNIKPNAIRVSILIIIVWMILAHI